LNQASSTPIPTSSDRNEVISGKVKAADLILAIPGQDVAITREQAAIRVGCDQDRISELIDEGKIVRFWREGKRIMMWLSDVDAYIHAITEKRCCLPSLLPKRQPHQPLPQTLTPTIPKRIALTGKLPVLPPIKVRRKRTKRNSEMKGRLE
jgi:excisionase family DNA binding protein